jgi:hypothetical protein
MILLVPGLPILGLFVWMNWFVARRDRGSRRPFDAMPRPPGWSLQQRMEDLLLDYTSQIMVAAMIGILAWALALSGKVDPWVIVPIGAVGCIFYTCRAARTILRYSNHRLGLLGEQVVGQFLDKLASPTLRVFHDLEIREPGKKPWNIDHVVVTQTGVYAIETKSRRKPKRVDGSQKGHELIFDGQQIVFPPPMKPDRHGLHQAQRNGKWLAEKLTALNGESVVVSPALIFPGWWVTAKGKGDVTVLNEKQIQSYLSRRSNNLPDRLFRAISNQLEERCKIDLSRSSGNSA